jgi:hypothetical protein
MKKEEIHNDYTNFLNDEKYKKYFYSSNEIWVDKLNQVKKYIDENNKRPSSTDENIHIRQLGSWILHQNENYNIDINKCKNIMKNEEIYKIFTDFISSDKYKKYFKSNENLWFDKFSQTKKYIDINNKKPLSSDKNNEIKQLASWLSHQFEYYNTDINKCKQIMKNEEIFREFTNFINDEKYEKYFQSNELIWFKKLIQVKNYIDINNKRPSYTDNNFNTKQLGYWMSHQNNNYNIDINKCKEILKNENIYIEYTKFINDNKYKHLFKNNKSFYK